ncbi:MAG: NACHT domain-containing protein [Anaerolineae bacterium]|nr:NACHT domain-containing protein [Anaerolineae bacterium]
MRVKDNSVDFRADWFIKQFDTGSESPFLDFKACVYKLDEDDEQSEFARDVIAFANVARRTNKKCHILFGIDAKEKRVLRDVRNDFPREKLRKLWNNPNVSIHDKQIDGIQKVFYEILEHWIDPQVPDLALQYGEIDGTFVSYLEIKPTLSSCPFAFKKSYVRKDGKVLNKGDVFIRKGASTVRLPDSEISSLYSYNQVVYLERSEWREIIRFHLSGDFEKMQNLSPYSHPKTDQPDVTAFAAARQAVDSGKRLIVITGHAGSGKTVLLHRLAYAIAKRHNLDLPTLRQYFGQSTESRDEDKTIMSLEDELEVAPPFPIPIFMSLRAAFTSTDDLEKQLLAKLQDWTGKDNTETIDQFLKIPGTRWIILFDGVDEIRGRERFAPYLRNWIHQLPKNVQCVVTSRPGYVDDEYPNAVRIEIRPLSSDDIFYLLREMLSQDVDWADKQTEIQEWLSGHPDLIELLTCPRALVGFVNQLTSVPPLGRPSIDQDWIKPVAEYKPEIVFGNDDAPAIDVEPNPIQVELPEKEEVSFMDRVLLPRLAIAVQAITNFMRSEEVKRRREWGEDQSRIAKQAKIELDETAWHCDWSVDSFDSKECQNWITSDSCKWNEDIGFIRYRYPRRYQFMCELLHHYFCAEYAWDFKLSEEVIKARAMQQGIHHSSTQRVIRLLNELWIENGRTPVNL